MFFRPTADIINFMNTGNKLIEKYNRPGPRYTSYPPVPFWTNTPQEHKWIEHIKESYNESDGVDLYVHVPYCEKLCFYCGCNRTITKNHDVEDPFMQMVLKEWDIYRERLGFTPKINSLHFGGGTPTFLSPENLAKLIQALTKEKTDSFIGSIEIDPRTCKDEHLEVLSELSIRRVSLGIQDFDPEVQRAINREQSVDMVSRLVEKIRLKKFKSVNFDLIYGLPKQTTKTITDTMEIVGRLRPDLIAFYGYAHLPARIKNQRLINEAELPSAAQRRELYEKGKEILASHGYVDIGLDHFALPGSYLHEAMVKGKLHRNFMGYVDKKSDVLIGLGPTSISDSSLSFVQNARNIDDYRAILKQGKLPIEKGHIHTSDDLKAQELILNLMCNGEISLNHGHPIPHWDMIRQELSDFEKDGVLNLRGDVLTLTPTGKGFMRNVAMSFDHHLRNQESKVKFSQTI